MFPLDLNPFSPLPNLGLTALFFWAIVLLSSRILLTEQGNPNPSKGNDGLDFSTRPVSKIPDSSHPELSGALLTGRQ